MERGGFHLSLFFFGFFNDSPNQKNKFHLERGQIFNRRSERGAEGSERSAWSTVKREPFWATNRYKWLNPLYP